MKLSSRTILLTNIALTTIIVATLGWLTYTTLLSSARGEVRAEQIRLISIDLQRAVASLSQLELAGTGYRTRLLELLPTKLANVESRASTEGWDDLAQLARESSEVLQQWRNSMSNSVAGQAYLRNQTTQSITRALDESQHLQLELIRRVVDQQRKSLNLYVSSLVLFALLLFSSMLVIFLLYVRPVMKMRDSIERNESVTRDLDREYLAVREIIDLRASYDRNWQALVESESLMRAVFEQSSVGIARVGPDGRWLQINSTLCDIFGYPAEELKQLRLQDITHPDDLDKDMGLLGALQRAEISEYSIEKRYIRKDGEVIWADLNVAAVWDETGAVLYFISVIQDITTKILAERESERQRQFFESTLECSAVGIVACNRDGQLTTFNRTARIWHEGGPEQIESLQWAERYQLYHGDGVRLLDERDIPLVRALRGEPVDNAEMVIATENGQQRFVLTSAAPVIDSNGNQLGAVASMLDVTERRNADLALRESHALLEQRVEERTQSLTAANERLKELDQLKSLFIASMSHELRTPLNSIIGFTGLLLMQANGDSLSERQRDYLERVRGSGWHLLNLITDIIDVSKIEAGKMTPFVESVSLDEVIKEAISSLQVQAENKGLSLAFQGEHGVIVETDRKRLLQCILNYISNAVKYSEQGEIRVRITPEHEQLKISVQDSGAGIAEKDFPRLFEQFSRIQSVSQGNIPGTGLGLYLTSKLVREILRGEVGFESTTGKGSTFWLKIPTKQND